MDLRTVLTASKKSPAHRRGCFSQDGNYPFEDGLLWNDIYGADSFRAVLGIESHLLPLGE